MWKQHLRRDDAVCVPRLGQGVIGSFGSGSVFLQAPTQAVDCCNCWLYPESRETPKWANMSIFSQLDYSPPNRQGRFLFFLFWNGLWFIVTLTRRQCAAQFFFPPPKWCRWYSLLLRGSPTLLQSDCPDARSPAFQKPLPSFVLLLLAAVCLACGQE